jgi:outer membrane protein assembly factor BamB
LGRVVSQFQACSVLSIVLNSFTGGCLYFTTSGPAQASITVQTSIDNGATWTNNTGSFTSPRCDIPTPTVTTRFRMQSVNAPLVYSNEIEFIPAASSAISCYGLTQVTNASFNESCLGTPYTTQSETITITLRIRLETQWWPLSLIRST